MSSINGWQEVGHGVGEALASVNNQPFAEGGWFAWLDDSRGFFANKAFGWACAIVDRRTGAITRAIPDASHPFYGRGMNAGGAGGGAWAARLEGFGLFTSLGLFLPDAGLMGFGPFGELGYKADTQSNGPTLVLELDGQRRIVAEGGDAAAYARLEAQLRDEGLIWEVSAGAANELQLLGSRRAIWQEGQRICVAGLPQCRQVGGAYNPRAHNLVGRWWASYWSDVAGIVAHPFDDLVGIPVLPLPGPSWHSARAFGTVLMFALASGPGEQPGEITAVSFDVTTTPLVPLEVDDGDEGGGEEGGGEEGGGEEGGGEEGGGEEGGGEEGGGEEGGGDKPPVEVNMKITVDTTTPPILGVTGETEELGNGNVAVKCPDGYLSLDSGGAFSFKPSVGPDETFALGSNGLVSRNEFQGVTIRIIPFVEHTS